MTSTTPTRTTTARSPKTSRRLVAALVAGGVALAGISAAVTMSLVAPEAHAQPAATSSSSTSSTHGSASSHTSHSHAGHHIPPVVPWSQSTETLQSQLAQLNYYDGHITGYWNSQTTDAVEYLQASAHLQQTGTMNAATQAALDYQLVHGDNQMGS